MHSTEISPRSTVPPGGGVFFPKGLVIGYHSRRRPPARVAAFETEICLGPGHYLLLARNGSGKTTLLRTLGRLIKPLEGAFRIDGRLLHFCDDLTFDAGHKPREILRALLDRDSFKTSLSFAGELELPLDRDYATLSRGNRQKLVAVLGEAAAAQREGGCVLLFDEPLSGLDFVARDLVRSWWRERKEGVCRIVSHHPDDATLEADAALVIRENTVGLVKSTDGVLDWSGLRHSLFAPRSEA
jgi:ABC-type multidrug transport system ATPase subunit